MRTADPTPTPRTEARRGAWDGMLPLSRTAECNHATDTRRPGCAEVIPTRGRCRNPRRPPADLRSLVVAGSALVDCAGKPGRPKRSCGTPAGADDGVPVAGDAAPHRSRKSRATPAGFSGLIVPVSTAARRE